MAKKYWIASATVKNHGALHRSLHVPMGQRIPMSKLTAAAHMKGKTGQRARLAMTLRKLKH